MPAAFQWPHPGNWCRGNWCRTPFLSPKKDIRIATARKAEGPYSPASRPFTPDWVEGPTAIKIGDTWYVYYDAYTRGRMEGARSKDLKTWDPITNLLTFPPGIRHGTAFSVSPSILAALKAQ